MLAEELSTQNLENGKAERKKKTSISMQTNHRDGTERVADFHFMEVHIKENQT